MNPIKALPVWLLACALVTLCTKLRAQDKPESVYFEKYHILKSKVRAADSVAKTAHHKLDSAKKVNNPLAAKQSESLEVSALERKKAYKKEKDLVSIERNATLTSIYSDNIKPTHLGWSQMTVGGDWENVLDANINLNFFILPKHVNWNIILNPRCNLRMFLDEDSAPIRTPSNYFGLIFMKPVYYKGGWYGFVTGSLNHHSNGQSWGTYNDDGTLDLKNGNFGVNYAEATAMLGKLFQKKGSDSTALDIYGKLGFQADQIMNNKEERNPATGEKALKGQYGQFRTNFEFSISKRTERSSPAPSNDVKKERRRNNVMESPFRYQRLLLDGSVVFVDGATRINAELKYYYKFPFSPNFMLTAQAGWLGHDYYNIYFEEQTWVVRAGFAAQLLVGSGTKKSDSDNKYKRLLHE